MAIAMTGRYHRAVTTGGGVPAEAWPRESKRPNGVTAWNRACFRSGHPQLPHHGVIVASLSVGGKSRSEITGACPRLRLANRERASSSRL